MLSSWTTSALYVFNGVRFRVSIPISHMTLPIVNTVKFNAASQCIDIEGYMQKGPTTSPKQRIYDIEFPLKKECGRKV